MKTFIFCSITRRNHVIFIEAVITYIYRYAVNGYDNVQVNLYLWRGITTLMKYLEYFVFIVLSWNPSWWIYFSFFMLFTTKQRV